MPGTARQKRFFQLVKARQHGHKVGGEEVQRAASTMKGSSVEDFIHGPTKPPSRSKEAMRARMKRREKDGS